MTVVVARHAIPADDKAARAAEVLSGILADEFAEEPLTAWDLQSATSTALALTRKRALLDPPAEEVESWYAWTAAMQASSAVFAAVQAQGSVECRIGIHGVRAIPAIEPTDYTDAGSWLDAFWLALICREPRRLDVLATVPESVLRQSGAVFDEYIYAWVGALQAFRRQEPEVMEKLLAAIDGTDPQAARVADRETLLKLLYPPIAAFYRLVQRDAEKFNEALVEGLELHREYWTAEEDRLDEPFGFVSLPLLAIACLARDLGIEVEVESDYLPKHLLLGSWVGEFDA
ncbi:immunity 49 family protein [Kitasatospora sp. NPDC001664]